MKNNFTIVNADTDSIMFCKSDQTPFTEEEQDRLLKELNSLFPEKISWEHDGVYSKVIVLKAKNYILWDGKKMKTKGSSLRSSVIEPAIKEFVETIIKTILDGKTNYQEIYHRYVREINSITDIRRWSSKKSITSKTLNSARTNEAKIRDAIAGTEYVEGDRCYFYFKNDKSLSLVEKFDGDYDKDVFYEKLFKSTERFESVLPQNLFLNYKLRRCKMALETLLGETK